MPRIFSAKVILFFLVMLALDVSLMPAAGVPAFRPVLLYLAVPYAAFEWQGARTVQAGLLAGFLRDLVSGLPLGVETVVLTAAALVLENFCLKIDRRSTAVRLVLVFLFVFSVSISTLALSVFLGCPAPLGWPEIGASLGAALAAAVFSLPVFFLAARWFGAQRFLRQYELFS